MKLWSEIKHTILLVTIISIISLLAFTLEGSEINNIAQIVLTGNKYLSEEKYLEYANLDDMEHNSELTMALVRDRLSKHPYIENVDVVLMERGTIKVNVFEKKMDAILLNNDQQYIITSHAEIIPLIQSTKRINLPVIINNGNDEDLEIFSNACNDENLFCALKIISTAELYDPELYANISELIFDNDGNISIQLTDVSSTIFIGTENEIEKTVYLSIIFKHMKRSESSKYLDYIDLRYNELVYLGFDEKFNMEKETI